jgi:hypothetical protein
VIWDTHELLAVAAPPVSLTLFALFLALVLNELLRPLSARAGRRRKRSEEKSFALLKEWLSFAQLAQYEREGHFEVRGSHSGKRYRIQRGRHANVAELDERGTRVASWCFGPEGNLAIGDVMLTQKIALETNESAAIAIANSAAIS